MSDEQNINPPLHDVTPSVDLASVIEQSVKNQEVNNMMRYIANNEDSLRKLFDNDIPVPLLMIEGFQNFLFDEDIPIELKEELDEIVMRKTEALRASVQEPPTLEPSPDEDPFIQAIQDTLIDPTVNNIIRTQLEKKMKATETVYSFSQETKRATFFLSLQRTLAAEMQTDRNNVIQGLMAYTQLPHGDIRKQWADRLLAIPEMKNPDMPILIQDNQMLCGYLGKTVSIEPPVPGAVKAREILYGFAFLLEDAEGHPLKIVHFDFLQAINTNTETIQGSAADVQTFTEQSFYGVPVSLEEIKETLDDTKGQHKIAKLVGQDFNESTISIFARARMQQLLYSPFASEVEHFVRLYNEPAVELFHMFSETELQEMIPTLNAVPRAYRKDIQKMLSDASIATAEAPLIVRDYSVGNKTVRNLFERTARQQLLEVVQVLKTFSADDEAVATVTPADWEMFKYSFTLLIRLGLHATEIAESRPLSILQEKGDMPADIIPQLLDFYKRHPKDTTVQTIHDFVTCVHMAIQEDQPYVAAAQAAKREFYVKENEEFKETDAGDFTTDTEKDVKRNIQLVNELIKQGYLPRDLSIAAVGANNTRRFESKLIASLQAQGIDITKLFCYDLNDFSDQFPENIQAIHPTVIVDNISRIELEIPESVDLVLEPWSFRCDMPVQKSLLEYIANKHTQMVKEGGVIIMDLPFPIGQDSYQERVKSQAKKHRVWGVVDVTFPVGDEEHTSMFNIFDIRELVLRMSGAGFVPLNFPARIDEQAALCDEIQENEEILKAREDSGEDINAFRNAIWRGGDRNRITLAFRRVSQEEVEHATGLSPSILIMKGFRDRQNKKDLLKTA